MSLRNAIPNFEDSVMALGSGKRILENYIKPLLSSSSSYYKISSFFTPSVIKNVLQQLEECFKAKGRVRLVIGVHDSDKLIPILDRLESGDLDQRFKKAVQSIVETGIQECLALAESGGFLDVFSELIKQNLIEIKIACVRRDFEKYLELGEWPGDDSTFHPKISIFKDGDDTVVMNGSINSTNKGFGDNVEEASFTGSWISRSYVDSYENVFNQIWENRHPESSTLAFDEEIRAILASINKNSNTHQIQTDKSNLFSFIHLQRLLQESPLFFHLSLHPVRLLPHQYLVYRAVLSRWPVVGLVADEVGLGKTIESGAVISYLKKFFKIKRTALLVPSALRHQWQNEMYSLFGVKFYIYDSNSKALTFSINNIEISRIPNIDSDFFNKSGVDNIIFSWHYVRAVRDNEYRLSEKDNVELVIVDEAHGARLDFDADEELTGTLLYRFLRHFLQSVPHKLLMTATPFQTRHFDYVSLLRILMSSDSMDESSLRRLASINANRRVSNQQKVDAMVELIGEKPYVAKGIWPGLDNSDLRILLENYDEDTYVKNHPTTIYTLRNTRDQLKAAGYEFPIVHLESSPIELDKVQLSIFQLADSYVDNHLFSIESLKGFRGIGFVKTIYRQRIVSSIKACYDTLKNRLNWLSTSIEQSQLVREKLELEEGENILMDEFSTSSSLQLSESEVSIARLESEYVREIVSRIEQQLFSRKELTDPKIDRALEIIESHAVNGESIIVFSRFTSTTSYLVQKLAQEGTRSFGRYQGDLKQYIHGSRVIDLSRQEIASMFANGDFQIIICSDAASEGLNLQTANVLINVDVPWNPARLLQRFGRIDRFGQKREELYFYNLFYPGTIEDLMYSRLHQRNNDFREILGATPEITSDAHIRDLQQREFLTPDDDSEFSYKNSLITLEQGDNVRIHELIVERLDVIDEVSRSESKISYLGAVFDYSFNELDSAYLNFNHEIFKHLRTHGQGNRQQICELRNKEGSLFFYCIKFEESIFPIIDIEELLDYVITGKAITRNSDSLAILVSDLERGLSEIVSNRSHKLIDHEFLKFKSSVPFELYSDLRLVDTAITVNFEFAKSVLQ